MSFLLKKVLFSGSTFQALTKQATEVICNGFFVKGYEVDQGLEGSATLVAADHDSSVAEPFSTRNC